MRRRDFVSLIGGAVTWPLGLRAQPASKLPTIGFLGADTLTTASTWVAAFVQRLNELNWIDGHTIAIQYRWGEARIDRMTEIAAEFVHSKVDVIVVYGTQATLAAKRATSTIPIVFTLPGDPVKTGLVASLARPDGNATGLSSETTDLGGKRLELLREIIPSLHRLAILANADNPANIEETKEVRNAAQAGGLDVATYEIRRTEDVETVFANLRDVADALYVTPDSLANKNRVRINTLASPHTYRP